MPPLFLREVAGGRVDGQTVVPDDQGAGLVGGTDLEVSALGDVVEQELEQVLGFFLFEPNDAAREALIDVEGFLPGHRVDTNERMLQPMCLSYLCIKALSYRTYLGFNRFTTNWSSALPGVLSLVHSGVNSAETLETLLELGGQPFVSFRLRGKEGVTSPVLGLVENPEESSAGRLQLIGLYKMLVSLWEL